MNIGDYKSEDFYDEFFESQGMSRKHSNALVKIIENLSHKQLMKKQKMADSIFFEEGITFNVYNDKKGVEKIIPFDLIPRIIDGSEWKTLENGLIQRVKAINLFITDIYNEKKILSDGLIPKEHVLNSETYRHQCEGIEPPNGIWANITGSDVIRGGDGKFYILEDNLRTPSGSSYVIENRNIMKRTFSDALSSTKVRPVEDYADHLRNMLSKSSYRSPKDTRVVLLTPGPFNSAYFEHAFLAQQMGVELVEPMDLHNNGENIMIRTTSGYERVDVIYRRIDDDFIDPTVFRADSVLGIPGVFDLYRKKKVAIVNAPGTGVADDKAIYPYVPEMIKYYLQEEPILNNIKTYMCSNKEDMNFVLDNIENLVVKATNSSGGYNMLIGSQASDKDIDGFIQKIKDDPRNYIAQPIISLSTSPILGRSGLEPRHVDLRPFVLAGKSFYVTPGGLTRVAMNKGSLVVNSSQGGGSKDTWVTVSKKESHVK